MNRSLWVLHLSRDGGQTWKVEQPPRIYMRREVAEARAAQDTLHSRIQHKAVEYQPVPEAR